MVGLFSKPKVPEVRMPGPLPPPPEKSDAEIQSLAEKQRAAFAARKGRAATELTGGQGTSGGSSVIRFLGGAAPT
jgi:hypothetical protein